jgi:hypothetical protein
VRLALRISGALLFKIREKNIDSMAHANLYKKAVKNWLRDKLNVLLMIKMKKRVFEIFDRNQRDVFCVV